MPVQQADQTPLVYPVSEISPPSHHQSEGSFAAVFIVLAVIVVVSAIACFLGRMCSKCHNKAKPSKHSRTPKEKETKHNHNVFQTKDGDMEFGSPKEKETKHNHNAFQTKDGDMEFGFDERFSSGKVASNGEPNMGRPSSFREQNTDPHMGRPNSFKEPSMDTHDSEQCIDIPIYEQQCR